MNPIIDIHQGDSAQTLARLLDAGKSWDYCLSSPPYFGLCDYQHPEQYGLEPDSEAYLDAIAHVFGLIHLGMTPEGVLWLNIGDTRNNYSQITHRGRRGKTTRRRKPEGQEKSLMNIPHRLLDRLKRQGWTHHQTYIWLRNASSQPQDGRAIDSHEYIFVLGNSDRKRPQLTHRPLNSSVIGAHPDVTQFPCKMPLALADALIGTATRDPGTATVIDPFIGSGTTAIAAQRRGYNCIGIDLDISASIEATQFMQGTIFPLTHTR